LLPTEPPPPAPPPPAPLPPPSPTPDPVPELLAPAKMPEVLLELVVKPELLLLVPVWDELPPVPVPLLAELVLEAEPPLPAEPPVPPELEVLVPWTHWKFMQTLPWAQVPHMNMPPQPSGAGPHS
jgi:periplasmic protein TonB